MRAYIERSISEKILEASNYFSVICITGPRQSGKSTLIKHLFPQFLKYTLEDLDVREYATNDPVAFLNQTSEGMILDEVQQAPSLLSYIQGIVDEHPERKFILSGSSNFAMLRSVSQSLAGRVGMFELLPMSYMEVVTQMERKTIDELLFDGLYPAICAGDNVARYLYPSYVKTYLDKDVRDLLKVRDLMQFNTFLKLCAGRIGSIFNASELANEVGVASNTITQWLSILQASYVITLLRPYTSNVNKRLIKSPKLYFCDTGLACNLLGIESSQQLSHDKMRGHLYENFIVMEALKSQLNDGREGNLYFYRDSNGNEIDLLVPRNGELTGIEIKSAMTYSYDFQKTLIKMPEYVKEPIRQRGVVYTGEMENYNSDIKILNYKHLNDLLKL